MTNQASLTSSNTFNYSFKALPEGIQSKVSEYLNIEDLVQLRLLSSKGLNQARLPIVEIERELRFTREVREVRVAQQLLQASKLSPQTLVISYCNEITDQALRVFKNNTFLAVHFLFSEKITDKGFSYINELSLKDLSLCKTSITDLSLFRLLLAPLKTLNLSQSYQFTDAGLAALSSSKTLESLTLGWCQITDTALEHISKISSLKFLSLYECRKVTDKGFLSLSSLPSLESIDITACKVSKEGIAAFRKALGREIKIIKNY